jgi:hypothetical protein
METNMTQYEAVVKALKESGGSATLDELYRKIDYSSWETQTPHESIRRTIYSHPETFVSPSRGVWALRRNDGS